VIHNLRGLNPIPPPAPVGTVGPPLPPGGGGSAYSPWRFAGFVLLGCAVAWFMRKAVR